MLGAAVGLPLAVGGFAVIVAILVFWVAAVLSLFAGPTGAWELAVLYVVVAIAMPIPMLGVVRGSPRCTGRGCSRCSV